MRPRVCYLCGQRPVAVAQELRPFVVLYLDGRVERGRRWEGRYLCVDHESDDPWETHGP